ncbi:ATP/GTP-binding protein [Rhodococcus hoagii]|nr:ATP/GTP-binding protein [Prescottella equi]
MQRRGSGSKTRRLSGEPPARNATHLDANRNGGTPAPDRPWFRRPGRRPDGSGRRPPRIPGHHSPGVRSGSLLRREHLPHRRDTAGERRGRDRVPLRPHQRDLPCPPTEHASVFVLGLPSFGKSTLARKFVSGAIAQGQIPFVFADTKPDFAKEIEIIGGDRAKIVRLGHGEGYLNPLGIGALGSIIPLLENFPQVQIKVIKQVHQRRKRIMQSLCEIERGTPLTQTERNVLTAALRLLEHDDRFGYETPPLISDLIALIDNPPQELMRKVYTQNADRYREKVEPLLETLAALLDGDLGEVFSQQTTTPIDFTGEDPPVAVCVDISALSHGDTKLEAAVMAACWEDGFGAIEAAHVLADCGLREQLHFLATLDEFWRVLSGGPGMVSRIDALTRLTRTLGTALVMITHTVKDLESLEADFDIMKAKGFIERAGAVIVGALPRGEMEKLDNIIPFTRDDKAWVSSLSTPGAYDPILGKPAPPPGRGHFLLKQGTERIPGHRFETVMTPTEIKYGWHDTDARFYGATAQGLAEREAAA